VSAAYDAEAARQRAIPWPPPDGAVDLRTLVQLGTLAPSSHNTQPWMFRIGDETIRIAPDPTRRCPVVDPDDAVERATAANAARAEQGRAAARSLAESAAALRRQIETVSETLRAG
jgi:hypothetical protein